MKLRESLRFAKCNYVCYGVSLIVLTLFVILWHEAYTCLGHVTKRRITLPYNLYSQCAPFFIINLPFRPPDDTSLAGRQSRQNAELQASKPGRGQPTCFALVPHNEKGRETQWEGKHEIRIKGVRFIQPRKTKKC
jgi:hypothetical protein